MLTVTVLWTKLTILYKFLDYSSAYIQGGTLVVSKILKIFNPGCSYMGETWSKSLPMHYDDVLKSTLGHGIGLSQNIIFIIIHAAITGSKSTRSYAVIFISSFY